MKINLRNFTSALLAIAVVIGLLSGNAKAEINMLESYPLVCQKALLLIDRGVESFDKEFGPPISKKSYKLTDPGFEGTLATLITYPKAVTVALLRMNGTDMIQVITLGSAEAMKKAGYSIQTKNEAMKLYGAPYEKTSNSFNYGCDDVGITFKIKNGNVVAVNIHQSVL